jgi:hypothetical protein
VAAKELLKAAAFQPRVKSGMLARSSARQPADGVIKWRSPYYQLALQDRLSMPRGGGHV